MIEHVDPTPTGVRPLRRRYRHAIIASVAFHVALLAGLFVLYKKDRRSVATATLTPQPQLADTALPPETLPLKKSAKGPIVDVPAEQIKASVQSQVEAASQASDERKLTELDNKLARLEEVSDDQSVQQVAKAIADAMGFDRNQFARKPTAAGGAFDPNQAQLRDVTRTRDQGEKWSYQALMVDVEGREATVPLGEAEGKSAFETFEELKKHPMANGIYQQLVMPMLQQMLDSP